MVCRLFSKSGAASHVRSTRLTLLPTCHPLTGYGQRYITASNDSTSHTLAAVKGLPLPYLRRLLMCLIDSALPHRTRCARKHVAGHTKCGFSSAAEAKQILCKVGAWSGSLIQTLRGLHRKLNACRGIYGRCCTRHVKEDFPHSNFPQRCRSLSLLHTTHAKCGACTWMYVVSTEYANVVSQWSG